MYDKFKIIIAISAVILDIFIVYNLYKIMLDNKKISVVKNIKKKITYENNIINNYKLNNINNIIESKYILPSNINAYLPFITPVLILIICFLLYIAGVISIYYKLRFFPACIVLAVLPAIMPLFILDIMGKRNSEKVRKNLAEFVSVLSRWCAVKEDIFYAFRKSLESGIGEPLRSMVRDMTIQIKCGIDPVKSLEAFSKKVNNSLFKDFVLNIRQNIKYRGNLVKLLSNLEEQFYRMEEEYNKRKISTYKDRIVLYVIMVLVLVISWLFIGSSPKIYTFYIKTSSGKMLLAFFSVMYILGLYTMLGIEKFKEG